MSKLERYVEHYGAVAGPKLYHALQSRSAYIGVSHRRRRAIEALTGVPIRVRAKVRPVSPPPTPLLPDLACDGRGCEVATAGRD